MKKILGGSMIMLGMITIELVHKLLLQACKNLK